MKYRLHSRPRHSMCVYTFKLAVCNYGLMEMCGARLATAIENNEDLVATTHGRNMMEHQHKTTIHRDHFCMAILHQTQISMPSSFMKLLCQI